MSSLATTHKQYILERLMLDYFYNGVIPTSTQLEADLASYMLDHPNLNEPVSKSKDWSLDQGSYSSAAHIHDIADTVSQDVGVITREVYRIAEMGIRFYDRWTNEMKRLAAYARKLEQRVDSLLLLNNDTMGFFAYVGDVFSDMNNVDTDETTARVDLYSGSVSINPYVSELSAQGSLINLSHITESDITFQPLNKKPGVAYMTTGDGNMISNVFKTNNSTWVGRVISESGGEMVCELKVKLGTKDYDVSRLSVQFSGPLGTSDSTVTCLYSADGYTWSLVPSSDPTKTMTANASWVFPLTSMRWIKLVMHKPAPDSTDNSYVFSISHIKLFGSEYDSSVGNIFVSSAMQAVNASGNPILFSLVALDSCEELVDGTGIDYSISASKDNEIWTDWMMISPSSFTKVLYPKIINLSGADWKDNLDIDNVILFDEPEEELRVDPVQKRITRSFNNTAEFSTHLLGYRFKSSNYGVINTAILISPEEDPDPISNSVVVWRNTRYRNILDYPDTLTVRGSVRGWGFDGSEYNCYFEVIDSNGKTINFGDKECSIDGSRVSGAVTIPAGVHKFTTNKDNWYDISDVYISGGWSPTLPLSTQEDLESIDPLYPYNHKLLIDGFPYPTGDKFIGEKIYTGTDNSAEFYAVRASLFDLENNLLGENEYGYFSIRSVGDEEKPAIGVVVRFDISNPDYADELFSIRWRSGSSNN